MFKNICKYGIAIAIVACLFSVNSVVRAAEKNMLIVFDASGSMKDQLGGQAKIDFAKTDVKNLLTDLDPTIKVGLRPLAYTTQTTKSAACVDTKLIQPFTTDHASINDQVDSLQAIGLYTPLAYALQQAKTDFVAGNDNVLILLTDGQENCGGDPSAAAAALKSAGVAVKTYVIGLGVNSTTKTQLQAVAQSGGGKYYDASDSNTLASSFQAIATAERPVDKTNTDSLLGKEVTGGNGFETAVDITPGDYHLSHNQKGSQYDYFKMPVNSGEKIKISVQTAECSVTYDPKTDTFTEQTAYCSGDNAGLKVYSQRRAKLGYVHEINASSIDTDTVTVDYTGIVYFLVGNDSSAASAMSKKSIFSIEVVGTTPAATTQTTNTSGSPSADQFDSSSNSNTSGTQDQIKTIPDKDLSQILNSANINKDSLEDTASSGLKYLLFIVGGIALAGILFVVIIIVIIVIIVKKNKAKKLAAQATINPQQPPITNSVQPPVINNNQPPTPTV